MNILRRGQRGIVLGLMVVALGACKQPTLTLVFTGLPHDATALAVRLSSPTWSFAGADVGGGPVTVTHPGGGVLQVEIERGYLATHDDRLRLALEVPEMLEIAATATATETGQLLSATAHGSAAPGHDLELAFSFGEPENADAGDLPARDAGAPEALMDGPPVITPDAAVADIRRPDVPDTAEPDTKPDVPSTCTVGPMKPASASRPSGRPTIAYAGGVFGVAWSNNGLGPVYYNAVDAAGTLQNAQDRLVAAPATMETNSPPLLVAAGKGFGLVYGRQNGGAGSRSSAYKLLEPATGAPLGGPVFQMDLVGSGAVEVGGAVVADNQLVLIQRLGGAPASQAHLELYTADPPTALGARAPGTMSTTRTTALAWASGAHRFAAAYLVDGTASGGRLTTFDASLADDQNFNFTRQGDAPVIGTVGSTISIAGGPDRFAVAWIDGQACPGCTSRHELYLTLIDAGGSTRLAEVHASDPSAVEKSNPHVIFDGRSFAAVWTEYVSPSESAVKFRRFDGNLSPLGPPIELTPGANPRPQGEAGLAAAGPNDYGVALTQFTGNQQFVHITCTGP